MKLAFTKEISNIITLCITCYSNPPGLRTTTWHIDDNTTAKDSSNPGSAPWDPVKNEEGLQLLAAAARRVWDEMYFSKKLVSDEAKSD